MTRRLLLPLAIAASLGAGVAVASDAGDASTHTGVIVETTRGVDPVAVRAARGDVARLRAAGQDAELRVTRSPSESLAAAATLVTRGAGTLVTRDVDEHAVLEVLERRHPDVRIIRRAAARW